MASKAPLDDELFWCSVFTCAFFATPAIFRDRVPSFQFAVVPPIFFVTSQVPHSSDPVPSVPYSPKPRRRGTVRSTITKCRTARNALYRDHNTVYRSDTPESQMPYRIVGFEESPDDSWQVVKERLQQVILGVFRTPHLGGEESDHIFFFVNPVLEATRCM